MISLDFEKNTPLILIVDDEKTFRLILSRAMARQGYRIAEAEDGKQCLKSCQQLKPDLILLDAMMPQMDGFTCCTQLTKRLGDECPIVLMITTLYDKASVDRAFEVGATDYVTKPIDWPVLFTRVRHLLQTRWAMTQLRQQTKVHDSLPLQIAKQTTTELIAGNATLRTEIIERMEAESALSKVRDELEIRVQERTAELTRINQSLQAEITERKRVESELREMSVALENAVEGISRLDTQGCYIAVNRAYASKFGYKPEEMIGMKWQLTVHPEERENLMNTYQYMLTNGKSQAEARGLRKDGSVFYKQLVMVSAYDKQQKFIGHYGFIKDITERKETESQIKASLKEKEVLLKEIHHRVKNNLQIISSLLNLQSEYIQNKQDLEIFRVSQNRIESMALIHEKLYQSKDLAQIEFDEYIRDLVYTLFCSYEVYSFTIDLKINSEKICLSIDTAISCGLIINELILNSLKHAFPPGYSGKICLKFYSDNDKITLIVSDNGIGLPEDFDFKNTESLGLQLVNALTNQLGGTIEINVNKGVEFKIIFSV